VTRRDWPVEGPYSSKLSLYVMHRKMLTMSIDTGSGLQRAGFGLLCHSCLLEGSYIFSEGSFCAQPCIMGTGLMV
jgi:hypothetical protein